MESVAKANEETRDAWDGPLFDRFVSFRKVMTDGLGAHGEEALRIHPPPRGGSVLDIGCGFGDVSQRLAELVGPDGKVTGIDVSERFIEVARVEAAEAGLENARFIAADVQTHAYDEAFDFAFSRMGTMFFASPVAALRNVREALVPGGRLCMVVWRRKLDNEWLHRAELVVKGMIEAPEDSDEPTCGPGPFSMADADTTSAVLTSAGFEQIELRRVDLEITIGDDLDEAIGMVTALGPAGEVIRLAGEAAEAIRPEIDAALRADLSELHGPDGVRAGASTWVVSAVAPS